MATTHHFDSLSPISRSTESNTQAIDHPLVLRWFHLFALACAGIFIMVIGMVVGAKITANAYFEERESIKQSAAKALEECQRPSNIIQVTPEDIVGQSSQEMNRPSDRSPSKRYRKFKRKRLTAAQKAMIAQMDNGPDHSPNNVVTPQRLAASASEEESDGLQEEQIYKVVNRRKRDLRRCYETALRATPIKETFRLDIGIAISETGQVTQTDVSGRSMGNMKRCVERTTRMWRFPTAKRDTRITFPVVFQPGTDTQSEPEDG